MLVLVFWTLVPDDAFLRLNLRAQPVVSRWAVTVSEHHDALFLKTGFPLKFSIGWLNYRHEGVLNKAWHNVSLSAKCRQHFAFADASQNTWNVLIYILVFADRLIIWQIQFKICLPLWLVINLSCVSPWFLTVLITLLIS